MSEIPQNWVEATLGEVCSNPQYGWTSKSSKKGLIKLLRTTDISGGMIHWESVPYCDVIPHDLEKYLIQQDDILVSRAGSVGISAHIKNVPVQSVFASYLIRFKPRCGVNVGFISAYLLCRDYWRFISESSSGIAVPNVNASKLAQLPIPLPPLNEQRRIVTKLDQLLPKVRLCEDRLEQVSKIMKKFRQSVLAAACSGKLTADWRIQNKPVLDHVAEKSEHELDFEIPDQWINTTLRSVCLRFQYGTSTKSERSGKVPVLRMGNLQNGKIDWSDLVYTSDEDEIKKYALHGKAVLFNRTNSPELVGKTSLYNDERPAIFAGYLIKIVPSDSVLPEYINIFLNTLFARELCGRVKTDGVSQSNINAKKLGEFPFPLCTLAEQKEIIHRVESHFKIVDEIESRYQKAKANIDKLTQSILAKAFRGELVAQDPNDEPASVLLERIRAERNKDGLQTPKKKNKRLKDSISKKEGKVA